MVHQQPRGQGLVIEALPFRLGGAEGRFSERKQHPALLQGDQLVRIHPAQEHFLQGQQVRRVVALSVVQAVRHHRELVHAARKAVFGAIRVIQVRQVQRMAHLMDNGADSHRLRTRCTPELRGAEIIAQGPIIETGVNHLLVLAGPHVGMMRPNGIRSGAASLVVPGIKEQHQVQDSVSVGIVRGKIHLPIHLLTSFVEGLFGGRIAQPLPLLHQVLAVGRHGFIQEHRPVNVKNGAEQPAGVLGEVRAHRSIQKA